MGSYWAADEARRVLSIIKDGYIPDNIRAYLEGAIAGVLMKERNETEQKYKELEGLYEHVYAENEKLKLRIEQLLKLP